MKNILLIVLLLISIQSSKAQTYLEGWRAIPFSEVANSTYLPQNQRLSTISSFAKLKEIDQKAVQTGPEEMAGECWLVDGMLVKIVTRSISSEWPKEDLRDIMAAYTPDAGGDIRDSNKTAIQRLKDDFFVEIKSVNDFKVLINYQKTMSKQKGFTLYDNQNRYGILGTVFAKEEDFEKAHTFVNTLLNSITFK